MLNAVNPGKTLSEPTNIHVGLDCIEFLTAAPNASNPDPCAKKTKLSSWIAKSAAPFAYMTWFTQPDVDAFVSWEYKIGTKTVSFDDDYILYATSMPVTVTAKTQRGVIKTASFNVKLHVNNAIKVCEQFQSMWYQTSHAPVTSFGNFYLFPKSDFPDVTFDYHPNIGLNYDVDEFWHMISTVTCTLALGDRSNVTVVNVGAADSKQIVKQFAVQALFLDTTKSETKVDVACVFKYSSTNDAATGILTQPSLTSFATKDEESPWIFTEAAKCSRNGTCTTKLHLPYQACGDNRVYATVTATKILDGDDATCCTACTGNVTPSCSPILELPSSTKYKDIKRCQPSVAQESVLAESVELVAEIFTAETSATETSSVTAVLAASALVALVVVQRRRGRDSAAAARTACAIEEDAYYPLLN